MMKFVFVAIILTWAFVGFLGVCHAKDYNRTNYEMLIFMGMFPFIPFVAHWCGLF